MLDEYRPMQTIVSAETVLVSLDVRETRLKFKRHSARRQDCCSLRGRQDTRSD